MKMKETYLRRTLDIRGKAVGFRIDDVTLPDGGIAKREYLDHPGAVAIIPLLNKNNVIMVKQFRYAVDEVTLEVPAGKIDPNEPPLKCAIRELTEETGYTAKKITKILSFWPTAAFANEIIHVYVAEGLTPGNSNPDDDEFLSCEVWPLKKLYAEIKKGKIKDAKTLIALMALKTGLFGRGGLGRNRGG